MHFPEFTAFTRHLRSCDPADQEAHASNVDCVEELSAYLEMKGMTEVVACLDAAASLVRGLAEGACASNPEWTHQFACRLVDAVDEALGSWNAKADEAPTEEAVAGAEPVKTEIPMPDFDEIGGEEAAPASVEPAGEVADALVDPGSTGQLHDGDNGDVTNQELSEVSDMVLGSMLIEMGYVTPDQVAEASAMHRDQGMAIGECLLMMGAISPGRLLETLKIQSKLRHIGEEEEAESDPMALAKAAAAAAMVEMSPPVEKPAEAPKKNAAMLVTESMFLGEVLLGAEMIDNDQLEQAMHIHHLKGLRIGEALVQIGALTVADVESGLELQGQLRFIAGLPKNTTGA